MQIKHDLPETVHSTSSLVATSVQSNVVSTLFASTIACEIVRPVTRTLSNYWNRQIEFSTCCVCLSANPTLNSTNPRQDQELNEQKKMRGNKSVDNKNEQAALGSNGGACNASRNRSRRRAATRASINAFTSFILSKK